MTDSEATINATNRKARMVVRAAEKHLESACADRSQPSFWVLRRAVEDYREADRRAQKEATA